MALVDESVGEIFVYLWRRWYYRDAERDPVKSGIDGDHADFEHREHMISYIPILLSICH